VVVECRVTSGREGRVLGVGERTSGAQAHKYDTSAECTVHSGQWLCCWLALACAVSCTRHRRSFAIVCHYELYHVWLLFYSQYAPRELLHTLHRCTLSQKTRALVYSRMLFTGTRLSRDLQAAALPPQARAALPPPSLHPVPLSQVAPARPFCVGVPGRL
jgi:hypothetical protein